MHIDHELEMMQIERTIKRQEEHEKHGQPPLIIDAQVAGWLKKLLQHEEGMFKWNIYLSLPVAGEDPNGENVATTSTEIYLPFMPIIGMKVYDLFPSPYGLRAPEVTKISYMLSTDIFLVALEPGRFDTETEMEAFCKALSEDDRYKWEG